MQFIKCFAVKALSPLSFGEGVGGEVKTNLYLNPITGNQFQQMNKK